MVLVFSVTTGFQERVAVVEGKADQLLAARHDRLVAEGAGFRQRQVVILGMFNQVNDLFQLFPRFSGLAIETLGQNHRQQIGVRSHRTPNHSRVGSLSTGSHQTIARQHESVAHHLNQVLVRDRNVARSKNGNTLGAGLLNSS